MNLNVLSVCGSTYCLRERRSMELSVMLDLTWRFVWTPHVCIGFSLTNIPKGLEHEKTRLLPLSVLSTSMTGHRKVPRVSFVPKTTFWSRSSWPPLGISKRPKRRFSWNISWTNTVGRDDETCRVWPVWKLVIQVFRRCSPDHLSTEEISPPCISFFGSRSDGSARLGSRRYCRETSAWPGTCANFNPRNLAPPKHHAHLRCASFGWHVLQRKSYPRGQGMPQKHWSKNTKVLGQEKLCWKCWGKKSLRWARKSHIGTLLPRDVSLHDCRHIEIDA